MDHGVVAYDSGRGIPHGPQRRAIPPPLRPYSAWSPILGARLGITRVALLGLLLDFVDRHHDNSTRRFLGEDSITMLNDRSSAERTGKIVENGVIRYHPETLRAAVRRSGDLLQGLEGSIASVERAAMSVSVPIDLRRGDILLLSNHRTLHCRGECSLVFQNYPMRLIQGMCQSFMQPRNGRDRERWNRGSRCAYQQSAIRQCHPAATKGNDGGRCVPARARVRFWPTPWQPKPTRECGGFSEFTSHISVMRTFRPSWAHFPLASISRKPPFARPAEPR